MLEEDGEYTPGHVTGLNGIIVVQISAGDSHTAALAQNGDVYCWGVFRVSLIVRFLYNFSVQQHVDDQNGGGINR